MKGIHYSSSPDNQLHGSIWSLEPAEEEGRKQGGLTHNWQDTHATPTTADAAHCVSADAGSANAAS